MCVVTGTWSPGPGGVGNLILSCDKPCREDKPHGTEPGRGGLFPLIELDQAGSVQVINKVTLDQVRPCRQCAPSLSLLHDAAGVPYTSDFGVNQLSQGVSTA